MISGVFEEVIGSRYVLLNQLGRGGSGKVYRCKDRLSGELVALKRYMLPAVGGLGEVQRRAEQLLLANEFRLLASLHHPHIISVLDYGFDEQHQPFLVMEYLRDAQDLLSACGRRSVREIVSALVQVLEGLSYLHRRGLEHGDLQPENVLVCDGRARLVNLGLLLRQGQFGIPAYQAPEVLARGRVTSAADLYAVGVMACELLSGRRPYAGDDAASLLVAPLDAAALDSLGPALGSVVRRLIARQPEDRFPDAHSASIALRQACGAPLHLEEDLIRESFLQAASFVGREAELDMLLQALGQATQGKGSAWLIGGESGVGKSRLLEELRVRALAQGAQVLRGQAIEGMGQPYQLWRDPLRRLALTVPLNDLQAAVIKPLVTDLEMLLERLVPPAPGLSVAESQERLSLTILDLLHAAALQSPPLVLLLEDLQWAMISLGPLITLSRLVDQMPILVVGSYRDDERPDLPGDLPAMRLLPLMRLNSQQVAQLSVSMLGETGRRRDVVDLLVRETEGNIFFVVETVRALVEEAGSLDRLADHLPNASIVTDPERRLLQRRLSRVAYADRELLDLAAIGGRSLDLRILGVLAPDVDIESWLARGANAAVLEAIEGGWRFRHDKLRDELLAEMDASRRSRLHQRVAYALEAVYAGNDAYAATLFEHWDAAGDVYRARQYARRAGAFSLASYAHKDALRYFSRALDLTPQDDLQSRFELVLEREAIHQVFSMYTEQQADLLILADMALRLGKHQQAVVALRQAIYADQRDELPQAVWMARQAIELARSVGDSSIEAQAHVNIGSAYSRQQAYEQARKHLERAVNLARHAGLPHVEAEALRSIGNITRRRGDPQMAQQYYQQARDIYHTLGDRYHEADMVGLLGIVLAYLGDYAGAQSNFEYQLKVWGEIGDHVHRGSALMNLGETCRAQGNYEDALRYLQQGLEDYERLGDRRRSASTLNNLGFIYWILGKYADAEILLRRSLEMTTRLGLGFTHGFALTNLANVLTSTGRLDDAVGFYRQALERRRRAGEKHLAIETQAGQARLALAQGKLAQALAVTEEILAYLDSGEKLLGVDEPFLVLWTCCEVLQVNRHPRYPSFLEATYTQLREYAALNSDPDTRQSFLEAVPWHRAIVQAWNSNQV